MVIRQLSFAEFDESKQFLSPKIKEAIKQLATEANKDCRGAIFTKSEVVDFILDLSGYTPEKRLFEMKILEPSFGGGSFLISIVDRLLQSLEFHSKTQYDIELLKDAILAVELHYETFKNTREIVINKLLQANFSVENALSLIDQWLKNDDFLLTCLKGQFDFVVGNPPYVRQELIPSPLLNEYRKRYKTLFDRADIYIPFFERSLLILKKGGVLGFICSNRWMKNRYGGPLRQLVASSFSLNILIEMAATSAFHDNVSAYPAITIIKREQAGKTRALDCNTVKKEDLSKLSKKLTKKNLPSNEEEIIEITNIANGNDPWLIESINQLALIRRLESNYPRLEIAGCKVGIGVATGADSAYISAFDDLDVEPECKLPLVTTRDISSGEINWMGLGVVNPFEKNGKLVSLDKYPKLKKYFEARYEIIAKRHCAIKTPAKWYRTIDRINPKLTKRPKLLIPDIKGEANIVYEPGNYYPHHNLYYIVSDSWDLRALQAVLLSAVSKLFIEAYSTKMRGGYLRFQAQYLRRICIPYWSQVPSDLKTELCEAAMVKNVSACNEAVAKLYDLNLTERFILTGEDS